MQQTYARARQALHSCAANNACWQDCNILVAPHRMAAVV
jgi:hypothetical protein